MTIKKKVLTREEDYRDYEERDIEEGWPYDDNAGAASQQSGNRPYGETTAKFHEDNGKGYTVVDTDETGNQEGQSDQPVAGTRDDENADDLEERVMDALSGFDGVSPELIDVRAEGSTIILEGQVDDAITARHLGQKALHIPGVTRVKNNLTVIGVDANIPDDE
jgi:osmotically-inducible protein OsmY